MQACDNRRRRREWDIEFQIPGDVEAVGRGADLGEAEAVLFRLAEKKIHVAEDMLPYSNSTSRLA